MQKDPLRDTVTKIESHCAENDIPLFHGGHQHEGVTPEQWQTDPSPDWKKFIGFFQQVCGKILHLHLSELNGDELDAWQESLSEVSGKRRRDHSRRIKKLRKRIKHLTDYSLFFTHEGKGYEFAVEASWKEELSALRYGLYQGEGHIMEKEEDKEEQNQDGENE